MKFSTGFIKVAKEESPSIRKDTGTGALAGGTVGAIGGGATGLYGAHKLKKLVETEITPEIKGRTTKKLSEV